VLATVAHLLDTTLIRVGNPEYARSNKSFGLTTLENRHVTCNGSEVRFRFRGKTGKEWRLKVTDRRIARIVKSCQDLPGQNLFQYEDDDGIVRQVTSTDVNTYLREIAGPDVSAKMFRTWAGTVLAAAALREIGSAETPTQVKGNVKRAVEVVATRLGNTATICRKCYIHPKVVDAYLEGELAGSARSRRRPKRDVPSLSLDEQEIIRLLSPRSHASSRRSTRKA
jgi:DNA topoisomerase-1